MTVCRRVVYRGRVQGVGFRYTAHRLAGGFAVGGFVRNLPSGDVELVAEGEAAEVDAFLAALAERMAGNIDGQAVEDQALAGWRAFTIRP